MIAVDTNVLVRLVLADDDKQFARAQQLFDRHADTAGAIWVSDVVLVELTWVLHRAAGHDRTDITRVIDALAHNATVRLQSAAAVRKAVRLYEAGPADFADCLLAVQAHEAGADTVHTFDRKMSALPGVTLL
jgi:predicted nucleic-acid-binding protein